MPLCVPKRNLGSDLLRCVFAVEKVVLKMPLSFPLPIKQASDCGSLRTTIYRSPAEPGQLDPALRLLKRMVMWLPPYTSVRDEPVLSRRVGHLAGSDTADSHSRSEPH